MNIFITGATGYLGKFLLSELALKATHIYVLIRTKKLDEAKKEFENFKNITWVKGDINTSKVLYLSNDFLKLRAEVDVLVHAASCDKILSSPCVFDLINVKGSENILKLAQKLPRLRYFHYISTIAVNGDYQESLQEGQLELGQSFSTAYAYSKFKAEKLVRDFPLRKVKKRIYRTGNLIGTSMEGKYLFNQGLSYFFEKILPLSNKKVLLEAIKYLPLPVESKTVVPLTSVKKTAKIISGKIKRPCKQEKLKCYHILPKESPSLIEFIQEIFQKLDLPVFVVPGPKNQKENKILEGLGLSKDFLSRVFPLKGPAGNMKMSDFSFKTFKHLDKDELLIILKNRGPEI